MKRLLLTTLFIQILLTGLGQTAAAQELFRIDSLPPDGLPINKHWRWHPGDNPAWAGITLDDARWDTIRPSRSIARLPAFGQAQQGWFRLRFRLDSAIADQAISAEISQIGASEVYLDGRLFLRLGVIGPDYAHQTGYTPATGDVYLLPRLAAGTHTIAVRLSQRRPPWYMPRLLYKSSSVFGLRLAPTAQQTSRLVRQSYVQALGNYLLIGIFLMLSIIHFLYYRYRRKSINLVFGFTLLCGAVTVLLVEMMGLINNPTTAEWLFLSQGLCVNVFMFMLLVTFYVYLNRPFSWLLGVTALLLLIPRFVVHYADDSLISSILSITAVVALFADGLRVSVDAIRSGRTNARFMRNSIWAMIVILLGGGVISSLLLNYYPEYGSYAFAVTNLLFFLTLPISFAIILAREYAQTNQRLEEQLAEVRKLAGEKERILGQQNETLERQVGERTAALNHSLESLRATQIQLESKNRDLEIEAALEKVRSRSLAMYKSDELQEVVVVVFEKLKELGLVFDGGAGIQLFTEQSKDSILWVAAPEQIGSPSRINLPYAEADFLDNPIIQDVWKAKETGEAIYNKTYTRDEKNRYFDYVFKHNDLIQVPQFVRDEIRQTPGYTQAFVVETHSAVIANSWSGQVFFPDKFDVFKRIAKVFDQAYIRFLDLQKAEAQAEQTKLDLIQIQTEKNRAEDALAELRITQTQLIQKEKLASLGELTAGIAHEIQNPLNFVNNFSEVSTELVTELEDEQQKPDRDTDLEAELLDDLKQNLQKITHHGQRASSIVKGMLEHSRASTGQQEPTDLNALADEYLRLSYHGLRAKDKTFNCALITDFGHDIGQVNVVPQDIGRVLLNLYNNAFYAVYAVQQRAFLGQEGYQPTVSVSTRQTETGVEIRVQDNGTGIPDTVKDRIFQPFFTTKPTGEGTGLGLSLSYDIITKGHGGTLSVESLEGEGTTFVIKLPG